VSVFEAMLRDRPDIEVSEPMLTAVLIACRASRNSECALRTMELLKSLFVPKPVHYRCVMESCADDRNLPAALAAFQALAATPGFQLTSGDYSYMFDVCRRCGDRQAGDLALSLFDKLLGDRNIEPDASTLAKLVKALGKCGNWKAALHCFERAMTECPTARDARLWNALITALGDNGQTARAKAQFDRMNERSQRDRFEPVPTVATYTAMMRVYLKAGRPFEVLAWFDRMKPDHVPDARAFNTLIAALHANELTRHLAFQYVDEAVRAGVYRSSLALTGDKLDFHIASLYTAEIPREADQGLPVGLAVALFDYHWSKGNIGEKSEFIVGFHGIGVLDEVIRQCMTAAGLEPVILDDGVLAHARARMKPVDAA
jgi:pentatricopeptide repeat protein